MKLLIVGGSGHVGASLIRHFSKPENEITVVTRGAAPINGAKTVTWDGESLGAWTHEIEGVDVLINLEGRSVNCRYNAANLKEMMDSRVISTRLVGEAISQAKNPPPLWLESSTATIYAHRFDAPNDEATGIIGGGEPASDSTWDASIDIAKAWEKTLDEANTPHTRKVAMRSAISLSPDAGSIFSVLATLAQQGLGGTLGTGKQFVSWVHEDDFCNAVDFLIAHEELTGAVNICSPNPLPQREFAADLRSAMGVKLGLTAPEWMVRIGTLFMRTESELVLKSRRVVPTKLLEAGFEFKFPNWPAAAKDLVAKLGTEQGSPRV